MTISARFDLVIGELNASLVVFYLAMQKYFAWITLFMLICLTVGFEYLYISIPHTIFMNGLLHTRLLEYYVLFLYDQILKRQRLYDTVSSHLFQNHLRSKQEIFTRSLGLKFFILNFSYKFDFRIIELNRALNFDFVRLG